MSHIITGPLPGGAQPRLEINNFVRDNRQFSLYVQALSAMQQVNQSLFPSFFQVGGIHGLPFTEYDGASASGFDPDPNSQWVGYCTHGSTLFPTWHRPYVMLIEQIINQHAQTIAGTYTTTDRAQWVTAATNLRQPYWDWAANMVPPPEVISLDTVTITAPDGSRRGVPNPLRRYTFHPIDSSFPPPYSNWQTTLRHPNSNDPDATDDINELRAVLSNSQRSITASTYNLMTTVRQWAPFADHTPGKGSADSIESIHDNIHVLVGGNGQMSDPSVAAFDPIFFLHHANVDRMLALWAALNPNTWLSPGDSEDGTWTLPALAPVDTNTALTPFWRTQTSFWTSTQVRSFTSLGYTYPEFQGLNMNNPQAVRTAISQRVAALYGPGSPARSRNRRSSGVGRRNDLAERARPQLYRGSYSDWSARVVFQRSEVGHSFSIVFFLGDVPSNPQDWLTASNFVGAHHAFIHSMSCSHCDRDNFLEEGFVPISPYIADRTNLPSFVANLVAPFLSSQLQWRVLSTTGEEIQLNSLEVTVLETSLNLPSGAAIPTVSDIVPWGNITQGRRGGYSGKHAV